MSIKSTGPPICQPAYRTPLLKRRIIDECIDDMLNQGIIRPSISPWSIPITLVKKPDDSTRFCVDYRKLNAVTVSDSYPLALISDILDQIGNSTIFTTLDLKAGYWQIEMDEESIPKTAFRCHRGLYDPHILFRRGLQTCNDWKEEPADGVLSTKASFQRSVFLERILCRIASRSVICLLDVA